METRTARKSVWWRLGALLMAFAFVAMACGDDDDTVAADPRR